MKNYLSILCFIICLSSFSQKKEFDVQKTYTVKEVLEDIDYSEKYLIKFHPDPFKYISKDSLHAFVLRQKAKIDTPLNEMQVRFCIKRIVAKIGCGHTDVAASKKYTKAIKKINRPILPLNVFVTDSNKMFVLNNLSSDTTIKAGDEIVSIDKYSIPSILKRIYSITTSDGYNETYKKQTIRYNSFKYYYGFCYGFKLDYIVKIKHQNNSISSCNLKAISTLKDTLIFPYTDSVHYIKKTKNYSYHIISEKKPIAIIDINGFKGNHWRGFFRKTFKDIKQKSIEHLVIDLRDNGGGQINLGLNFLSYLIDEKIVLPFDKKINTTSFHPKYKMGFGIRAIPILFSLRPPERFKNGKLRHYFIKYPKRKKQFKGQVYVLTNGKSFSMSSVASSYLKYKRKAIIIGEETGGNIAGSNAVINGKIFLPNTDIQIFIPLYHLYHDIDVKNNNDRGLMPDYPMHYTKEDLLKGNDLDLSKVIELVN
jgi:hypothetical protein